jgi:hypothetical protein
MKRPKQVHEHCPMISPLIRKDVEEKINFAGPRDPIQAPTSIKLNPKKPITNAIPKTQRQTHTYYT